MYVENTVTVLEGHKENCKDAKGVGVNRDGAFAEYLVILQKTYWPTNQRFRKKCMQSLIHLEMQHIQHFLMKYLEKMY